MTKPIQAGKQNKSLLKLIEKYYADLADFARQHVLFEGGTRHAFHRLMADAGKPHGWTLIAEQEKKVSGKTIRPDGTFKDQLNLVRGYWEAKDTADKLDAEIEKKRKAGYPLTNIIFEDTQTAVLYQHGQRLLTVNMTESAKLAELITEFFRYVEPEGEGKGTQLFPGGSPGIKSCVPFATPRPLCDPFATLCDCPFATPLRPFATAPLRLPPLRLLRPLCDCPLCDCPLRLRPLRLRLCDPPFATFL
jgi:hypothetical protein